ncbi:hypothetical protein [uncultured Sphingomonas sp.]|uniref:hypothetical protein n=1 Tax=uncultured Sphingomonas sp. TaxID=158754 RepID=UPI0035CC08D4
MRARVDDELADGWRVTVAAADGAVIGFVALRPDRADLRRAPTGTDRASGRRCSRPGALPCRPDRFYSALGPVRHEPGLHPRAGHPIVTYWF